MNSSMLQDYLGLQRISNRRLNHYLDASIEKHTDKTAIVTPTSRVTYGALGQMVNDYYAELKEIDSDDDEPIIIFVDNRPSDFAKIFAAWKAGMVPVPVNIRSKSHTIELLLAQSRSRYLLGDSNDTAALSRHIYYEALHPSIYLAKNQNKRPEDPCLKDGALIVFTSGTTGNPKGVVQGHQRYCGKLEQIYSTLPFDEDFLNLMCLQLTFSFGQWSSFLTLARGAKLFLLSRFEVSSVLKVLSEHQIGWFPVVPTMLRMMLPTLRTDKSLQLLHPKLFLTGGEILPVQLGRQFLEIFTESNFTDVYGLTETNSADFILMPSEFREFIGTIGRPSKGVNFKIVDNDGEPVSNGDVGELWVDTPFRMNGYVHQQKETNNVISGNYLKTGDLGKLTESGVVELVGRSKEIINKGGLKVSPVEIEDCYLRHPKIDAALACGVEDELKGEEIYLCLTCTETSLTHNELEDWGKKMLEHYKIPSRFYLVDVLPQGRTGKSDRVAMRNSLRQGEIEERKII